MLVTTSPNGNKRAALYARVSDPGQLDNSSPDEQLRREREYCQSKGYHIIAEEIEAMSGAIVLARSKFNNYLNMGADGKLDVIVVDIPDRLGRGDAIAKLELLAQLNRVGVEYATPGRDTSTAEGLALKATDQLVSGIERLNIRRRTLGGKIAWAQRGRVIASSLRPFAYQYVSKYDERGHKLSCEMLIVEEEARTVRLIFDWCVYDLLSTYSIARRLTDMQIPTPQGRTRQLKGVWRSCTVYKILTNRTYMGEWEFGKRLVERRDTPDGIKKRMLETHREGSIAVPVPAIISLDVWYRAQAQLEENKRKFRKPTKHLYMLRGRIHCALCGKAYNGLAVKRESGTYLRLYKCNRNSPEFGSYRCRAKTVKADLLESTVWDVVKEAVSDEERLFRDIKNMRAEAARARRNVEGMLVATEAAIQKGRDKLDRLLDLYTSGDLEKEEYVAKKEEVKGQIQKQEAERTEVEKRLGQYQVLDPAQEKELRELRAEIARKAERGTPEQRMKFLEMLRVECYYNYDTGELTVTGLIGKHTRTLHTTSACRR